MQHTLREVSEKQKASWNKFSPGWKKWDLKILEFMQPAADEIITMLHPQGAQVILDIAAGTGEPGLSIAAMLPNGKVVITDLADDMLKIAREHASQKRITNVEFRACDVSELPFGDNSFDAVSCRMGFMFFPDMLLAAREILRVLKPGGKFATTVWAEPGKNFWVTAMGGTINSNMQLPAPPPDAPGMFRCAEASLMRGIFEEAGFINISDKEINCELNCESADVYWQMMTEIAAPFVAALSEADASMKEKIKKEVYEKVNSKYPNGNVVMDGSALVFYGEK